jgi:hypothetical protein
MWFCCNFIIIFRLISVGILYCKDTKSGIKIPGFHQNIKDFQNKNVFCFQKFSKNIFENIVDFSAFYFVKAD